MKMRALGVGALVVAACACPSKQGPTGTAGGGSGSAVIAPPVAGDGSSCAAIQARVAELYRAEAQLHDAKRVDEAVADNTAMVMRDCAVNPAKVAPCVAAATTVATIEKTCLIPIDEEGTEGDALGRGPK